MTGPTSGRTGSGAGTGGSGARGLAVLALVLVVGIVGAAAAQAPAAPSEPICDLPRPDLEGAVRDGERARAAVHRRFRRARGRAQVSREEARAIFRLYAVALFQLSLVRFEPGDATGELRAWDAQFGALLRHDALPIGVEGPLTVQPTHDCAPRAISAHVGGVALDLQNARAAVMGSAVTGTVTDALRGFAGRATRAREAQARGEHGLSCIDLEPVVMWETVSGPWFNGPHPGYDPPQLSPDPVAHETLARLVNVLYVLEAVEVPEACVSSIAARLAGPTARRPRTEAMDDSVGPVDSSGG